MVPGRETCCASISCSPPRNCRNGGRDRSLATFDGDLELLNIATWDDARIASEQLLLGLELVQGLLVGAPRLLDLPLGSLNVGSRDHQPRVHLGDLPASSLDRRPLFGVVQPEELLSLSDVVAHADVNLGDASDSFRNNWYGPEE